MATIQFETTYLSQQPKYTDNIDYLASIINDNITTNKTHWFANDIYRMDVNHCSYYWQEDNYKPISIVEIIKKPLGNIVGSMVCQGNLIDMYKTVLSDQCMPLRISTIDRLLNTSFQLLFDNGLEIFEYDIEQPFSTVKQNIQHIIGTPQEIAEARMYFTVESILSVTK